MSADAEVRLPLPDGMAWIFLVDGQAMYPQANWPSTDGGTVICVRYDESDQHQQDAMVAMAQKFLDDIMANQIVKDGSNGGASAVDQALANVNAAKAVAATLIATMDKVGSDLLEIDTDDLEPATAAIIGRANDNLTSKVAPSLDDLDQLITRAAENLS